MSVEEIRAWKVGDKVFDNERAAYDHYAATRLLAILTHNTGGTVNQETLRPIVQSIMANAVSVVSVLQPLAMRTVPRTERDDPPPA